MRTRIKICGLTREADIADAVETGVDAIGFVFIRAASAVLPSNARRNYAGLCPLSSM